MARKREEPKDPGRSFTLGVLLASLLVLTALSLLSLEAPELGRRPALGLPPGATGVFGHLWATWWTRWLGTVGVWGLLVLALVWSARLLTGLFRRRLGIWTLWFASTLLLGCLLGAALGWGPPSRWGRVGELGSGLLAPFGPVGRAVLAVALFLVSAAGFLRRTLPAGLRLRLGRLLLQAGSFLMEISLRGARRAGHALAEWLLGFWERRRPGRTRRRPRRGEALLGGEGGERDVPVRKPARSPEPEAPRIVVPEEVREGGEPEPQPSVLAEGQTRPFPLPSLDLLSDPPPEAKEVDHEEIREKSRTLEQVLSEFGVQGRVSEVHPGPVITRYEFTPGPGVRIAQITSRADDIALALRAPRVRLLAPIPGKAAVGIEVPNERPAIISLKEVLANEAFRESRDTLVVALGKDITGQPFYAALEQMPHLLVAGTTGSGKSMFLHALLFSLMFRLTPSEVRFLLVDPKRLEFTSYNGIPYLLAPVVTEPKDAGRLLQWLLGEMDRRYLAFARLGVRNIQAYRNLPGEEEREELPMIVVVVDELADLFLTGSNEIETAITRLAQMSRAVGIHLVLATQRPSVDILTGIIKANFPARIAFQVASRTDSRTILDSNGAESLLGRGDMLYIPPGKAQAHRLHAPYLDDTDRQAVLGYLKEVVQRDPSLAPPPVELEEAAAEVANGADEDPLFEEAVRIVIQHQQGSTSLLQRKLRIGYTRAARLMDMMERRGIVGPFEGSKARQVLVDRETWEGREGDDGA
jgi:S-DNA-T family DNA segregation ATPase FtsK/SpoIIIE